MSINDSACPSIQDKIHRQLVRTGLSEVPAISERVVFIQNQYILKELVDLYPNKKVDFLHPSNPFYIINIKGNPVTLNAGGWAPQITQLMEEAIALGGKAFLVLGSCGSLERYPQRKQFYIIDDCIASDCISKYYLGSSDLGPIITPQKRFIEGLELFAHRSKVKFDIVRNWTVNALYLQTDKLRRKVLEKKAKCVDAEIASLFSVANYRKVYCEALLYWSDIVRTSGKYKSRDISPNEEDYQKVKDMSVNVVKWFSSYDFAERHRKVLVSI